MKRSVVALLISMTFVSNGYGMHTHPHHISPYMQELVTADRPELITIILNRDAEIAKLRKNNNTNEVESNIKLGLGVSAGFVFGYVLCKIINYKYH